MRMVIDETSLESEGITTEAELFAFADLLLQVRKYDERVGVLSGWGALPCSGADLATVLTAGGVSRDLGAMVLGLLDQCIRWDEALDVVVDPDVLVEGSPYTSYGVAFALDSAPNPAVIEFPSGRWEGVCRALSGRTGADLLFIKQLGSLPQFYRQLLQSADESDFFRIAPLAFPSLMFAEGLSFRRLQGGFGVREQVVAHLAAINDRFMAAYVLEHGDSGRISTRIGIDVSIEGNTRSSERLMSMRDVVVDGETFRCEWHSKIEPHRNRIHFYPADERSAGKVVVGLMVDHLPT